MRINAAQLHATISARAATDSTDPQDRSGITAAVCGVAASIFSAVMIVADTLPGSAAAISLMMNNRLLHFLAYLLLSGLIYYSLADGPVPRVLRALLFIALLSCLHQLVQATTLDRFVFTNWAFDLLTALCCLALLCGWQTLRNALIKRCHPQQLNHSTRIT
jgi:hypothetical protein